MKQWRAVHPNAEKVRRAICETALVQAVGRVRPLQRTAEAPVTVILFTDTPVEELGDVVPRLWAEMRPSRDEVTLARHGFMLANLVDAANAAPDVVKSAAALKMDRQKRYRLPPKKPATQQGGLSSGSPSTQTDESNFSLMENLLKEKVTNCPPPKEQVAPPPQPTMPIDVVVYQKAGARYKPATAVRLNVGMSSSEWLIQTVGALAGFDRMMPPIGEGGHQTLTDSFAMPQQMGTGTEGRISAPFSATLRSACGGGEDGDERGLENLQVVPERVQNVGRKVQSRNSGTGHSFRGV